LRFGPDSGSFSGPKQSVSTALPFWNPLFAGETPASGQIPLRMKLLTKQGRPLLLLPEQPRLAAHSLALYPAQTARGRLARFAARWILTARLPLGIQSVALNFSPDHPFVRWLVSLTPAPGGLTPFAVLAGNANSPGQRLILLLFNPAGQPALVVKAGVTEAARKLIALEQQFFASLPTDSTPLKIPQLRGVFTSAPLAALAMDFLPGRSPLARDEAELPRLLGRWLQPQAQTTFAATRVGRELEAACAAHPVFQSQRAAVGAAPHATALYHGDFTPWNVRVSPSGDWRVLDWERGEVNGLPAWDWFHYVVQKAVLVQHQSATALAATLEQLLASGEFQTYLRASRLLGRERALLLLYLVHQIEVVRPSEGRAQTEDLLQVLVARGR
jgi:hypothetical protein